MTVVEARSYVGGWVNNRTRPPVTFRVGWRNEYLRCWEVAVPEVL